MKRVWIVVVVLLILTAVAAVFWMAFPDVLGSFFAAALAHTPNIGVNWDSLLSAFLGTFVGAYIAFRLEYRSRISEQRRTRATEGNLALLTLFQMFNELRQFQKEVIATAPEPRGRWMRMKVTFPQSPAMLKFDAKQLAFLLESENTNLLPEVLLEERRFQLAIEMINRRSHLMLEKIHPILAKAGLQHGEAVEDSQIRHLIGPALAAEADQLTEGIVQNVNEDVQSLKKTFDELRLQLVRLVRGEKFIRVEFDMP